jgi:hypothetical protein
LSSGSRDAFGRCVDPVGLCAAIGVSLHVSTRSLRAKGREVFGAWDPVLRRIELFCVTPDLSDERLVRTFAHEFYHASRHARSAFGGNGHAPLRFLRFCVLAFLRFRAADEETAADEFADALLHTLGPECIARWAAALRDLARIPQENESAVGS